MLSSRTWPTLRRRDHQPGQHLGVLLLLGQELQRDVVLLVPLLVGRDLVLARDHQAHGVAHVGRAHAEVGGALAVDLHLQLGAVEADAGVDVGAGP